MGSLVLRYAHDEVRGGKGVVEEITDMLSKISPVSFLVTIRRRQQQLTSLKITRGTIAYPTQIFFADYFREKTALKKKHNTQKKRIISGSD